MEQADIADFRFILIKSKTRRLYIGQVEFSFTNVFVVLFYCILQVLESTVRREDEKRRKITIMVRES